MKAARADGSACGVRSPARYGAKRSPSTPGPHASASATRRANEASGASRSRSHCSDPAAESITPIACHWPGTAWQNACTRACGSDANAGSAANTTPEVPITIDSGPGRSMPTPSAAAAQSPAPAATGIPCDTSSQATVTPANSGDSSTGGSSAGSRSSASSTSADQLRRATSSSSVPDASATSVAHSPVSRRRT